MEKELNLIVAVILNYNSTKDTKKCISYLQKQNYNEFNIVVVDNNSPDYEQLKELKAFCREQGVEIILSDKNGGFSAGNNIGIRRAIDLHAKWVLIINPDVEIRDPNYVSYIMDECEKWNDVGVIASKILLPNGYNQNPMRELTAAEEIFFPIEFVKQKLGKSDNYKTEEVTGICEKVSGCCFFASIEFLKQNNLLDEKVFMYCEEPILAKSLVSNGYKALYIDEVVAFHQHFRGEKSDGSNKRMIDFLTSRKYYIRRYSGYGFVSRNMAVLVRNLEILFWKVKK